jgi:DNA repair protein RadC
LDILHRDIEGRGLAAGFAAAPPGDIRIVNRSAAIERVRSLPAGFSGSILAMFLDRNFNLLALDRLGQGNAAECGVIPLDLVHRGARLGAAGFILIHHAPERSSGASPEEYAITKKIRRAGEDFELHLLDHLILAGGRLFDITL